MLKHFLFLFEALPVDLLSCHSDFVLFVFFQWGLSGTALHVAVRWGAALDVIHALLLAGTDPWIVEPVSLGVPVDSEVIALVWC